MANIRLSQSVDKLPLKQQGGFAVFADLLPLVLHQAMLHEAQRLFPYAKESVVIEPDAEQLRGGHPPRSFLSVAAGPVQNVLYQSPDLKAFLEQLTGLPIYRSGLQGSYSFYVRIGDHLSLHRDVEACDLAVITCLYDFTPSFEKGGILCLYPNRCEEPLSQIRMTLNQGCVPVYLAPNQTIVMYGGLIPHLLTPIVSMQTRIVSILCFSIQNKSIRMRVS